MGDLGITGSKQDQIQALAAFISKELPGVIPKNRGVSRKNISSKRDLRRHDLKLYDVWLAEAHKMLRDSSRENISLSYTSEWMLDNYYIIRQAVQQVYDDLPANFYNQLAYIPTGPWIGLPRVYGIARALLQYENQLLDIPELIEVIGRVQESSPLTTGEIWSLPIFLRFCLIENLAVTFEKILQPDRPLHLPDLGSDLFEGVQDLTGQISENDLVSNVILSLRTIAETDWNDFFESVSCLEKVLRQDPAGLYAHMDFKSRDVYRKVIESLSFETEHEECEIAALVVHLAETSLHDTMAAKPGTETHIGDFLIGTSRPLLEQKINYHPNPVIEVKRWIFRHATSLYLSSILLLSAVGLFLSVIGMRWPKNTNPLSRFFSDPGWNPFRFSGDGIVAWFLVIGIVILMIIPAISICSSLINWLIPLVIRPHILPKMDFKDGIPALFQTLVVIPAIFSSEEEIGSLVNQLEMHYLRNSETGLLFGLLTDFKDADTEKMPEDQHLIQFAAAEILKLNQKYGYTMGANSLPTLEPTLGTKFYFLHRNRIWNESEHQWMGWERKRGKLHELNQVLRDSRCRAFPSLTDQMVADLQSVRFVITLDADTILPRGAACRLAGTLAHPLNQARFDPQTGHIRSGYTVLQPRMEIHPRSANRSWFTRIFSGDTGLDLYTLAVSDTYQDLFGEGSYVGKGIYDVDSFARCVDSYIPENTVLSHDLLEGILGRAALVSDITMIEDYPQHYFIQTLRQRRWIRGDWQILTWLFRRSSSAVEITLMDRWKIFDNLRRSLLAPNLFVVFCLGLLFFPGFSAFWAGSVFLALGIPVLTGVTRSLFQVLEGEQPRVAFRPLKWNIFRWILSVAFLPYETYIALDAILTTLYRLWISKKNLLQWTTAAQTTHAFHLNTRRNQAWEKMGASTLLALLLVIRLQLSSNLTLAGMLPEITYAAPVIFLWIISPYLAWHINRPLRSQRVFLNEEQATLIRQVTRRTWGFFERFVGPEDHWLPPDHYQEEPVETIAHRTSPTNIGLLLTSTLAAYDLGYLDLLALGIRLGTTMDTLTQLERYRGHFINWYDTRTLQPLYPRYISTVDSGNLAASFLITSRACDQILTEPIYRWNLWQGYLDTLANLTETLLGIRKDEYDAQIEDINHRVAAIRADIQAIKALPDKWIGLYQKIKGPFWNEITQTLMELVKVGHSAFDLHTLGKLQEVTSQVERHHNAIDRMIKDLTPWVPLLSNPPSLFIDPIYSENWTELKKVLPSNTSVSRLCAHIRAARPIIASLTRSIRSQSKVDGDYALNWLMILDEALQKADANAESLQAEYVKISTLAGTFLDEMDFSFLFHTQRKVFHIGLNLEAGQLDQNYYDLLASEARIASIIAIAKGDVPHSHWLFLGRPVTRVEGNYVLLSWSGTMFEYLMPALFFKSFPGTLLADSSKGAVLHQIAYGKARNLPWGISEAGFFRFDTSQNYQYRAFGVPGLGFKRGLADDLVIAPYASLMAIGSNTRDVTKNLAELLELNSLGLYGVYESIDFTPDRLQLDETSVIVKEYMAHHQGMIMMAMANFFHDDVMIKRMHSDPRIQSVELLLQEQVPYAVPSQDPYAEDVKGIQRLTIAPVEITPWNIPIHTPIPEMNLLSNGSYKILISNMGGGYSSWNNIDLTRWQPDGVLDPWGTWIYIQDMDRKTNEPASIWSVSHQPIPGDAREMQVNYFAHMAVFRRTENEITSSMEVTVAPDDPVEIRRINLQNQTDRVRKIRLTSYGEVILCPQAADTRHSAFNKMFINSEYVPELNLQIFMRRPRSDQEKPVFMGHMLVSPRPNAPVYHEADRYQFVGRNHEMTSPASLTSAQYLSGTSGATLDPIFALGQEVQIDPHENINLAYIMIAGESREEIIALAARYQNWTLVERTYHLADIAAQSWLGKQEISNQVFENSLQILSALLYSFKEFRTKPETLQANTLGQPGLWRFGVSGDYPILVVDLDQADQIDLAREVVQTYKYLRNRQFQFDLIFLNSQHIDYGAELTGILYRLISRMNGEEWLNQRGGIFIINSEQMRPEEHILLEASARVLLRGANGLMEAQMPGYSIPVHHLPELPLDLNLDRSPVTTPERNDSYWQRGLQFFNGFGGFSKDGHEYVIQLQPGQSTPAPWINVIGYPNFGFMVSEAGSQCTWAVNSGENRLTPWNNDPIRDASGEVLYLRDEETGEVWTPTPRPAGADQPYQITHGAGYSIFEHESHGLLQSLTLFASPEDPVKIIHLKVENKYSYTRRITATEYVEWVLGTTHAGSISTIVPEYLSDLECLLATNAYLPEFSKRTAFLLASKPIHGLTADRTEFLGRGGSSSTPVALRRLGLETRITPGEDPCAVLQLHLDLLPGAVEEIYFVLGQADDRDHAVELVKKYKEPAYVGQAYERTFAFWDRLLNKVQVRTPEHAADFILNRWMLYQTLSCRIWGRTGFYQSSGAFGFRDQLQDVLALLAIDPTISRNQILLAAGHQFEQGDVMHWWHPPLSRGVRTRISDDLLWLPYVTARYIEITGDRQILDEKIAYLNAAPLAETEEERYSIYMQSEQSGTLLDHCLRALDKGMTRGEHGLPLIGTGDWNDGLNRVGDEGKGESTWLTWFLIDVLNRFSVVCETEGISGISETFRNRAKEYVEAVERSGWDGAWYNRGFFDEGMPFGSSQADECQIDAIAQSWSVISGAGQTGRSRQALQAVLDRLVRPLDRLSLLFTPPFDQTKLDPGYIKGYLPGIRENGGQYTHAATWTAWAFAQIRDGRQSGMLFDLLNPIYQADTREKALIYRVEPYVIAADIYSVAPYLRRGGWTWYTGSAAWMFRLGVEAMLGFHKAGNTLRIDPVIPPDWDGYEIRYQWGQSTYIITIHNPEHVSAHVCQVKMDGVVLESQAISLVEDGRDHRVEVLMGNNEMAGGVGSIR